MNVRATLATLALLAVSGCCCARQSSPSPSKNHPASPLAAETPAPDKSKTLKAGPVADPDGAAPGGAAGADALATPVAYTCPHHPKVMEAEPGECPLCGMPLEATTSKQMSPLRQRNDLPDAAPDASPDAAPDDGDDAEKHEHGDAPAAAEHGENK